MSGAEASEKVYGGRYAGATVGGTAEQAPGAVAAKVEDMQLLRPWGAEPWRGRAMSVTWRRSGVW